MVDLDRFKDLNDRHGHAAGDAALVAVAGALSAVCNDAALVGRIGGEEFLIADLVKTERPRGWGPPVLRRCGHDHVPGDRQRRNRRPGVAGDDADQAFRQVGAHADSAMYQAKGAGVIKLDITCRSSPGVRRNESQPNPAPRKPFVRARQMSCPAWLCEGIDGCLPDWICDWVNLPARNLHV
jgi:GGDEF domain-containing protein